MPKHPPVQSRNYYYIYANKLCQAFFRIFFRFFRYFFATNYFTHQTGCFLLFQSHSSGCFLQKIINLYFLFYNFSSSFSIPRSGCFKKYFSKHVFIYAKYVAAPAALVPIFHKSNYWVWRLKIAGCFRHRLLLFIFLLRIRFI